MADESQPGHMGIKIMKGLVSIFLETGHGHLLLLNDCFMICWPIDLIKRRLYQYHSFMSIYTRTSGFLRVRHLIIQQTVEIFIK